MAKLLPVILMLMGYLFGLSQAHDEEEPRIQFPGAQSFVVPSAFPTSVFSSYYLKPAATSEPQPAVYDPQLENLNNTSSETLVQYALNEIKDIIYNDTNFSSNCSKCIAALNVGKIVAQYAPSYVPGALVSLCQATGFASNTTCKNNYAPGSWGAIWSQVLSLADVTGLDGQYICSSLSTSFCPTPSATALNTTGLFPKPKPANATVPRRASGERRKVLHLSDFHLDPRYQVASEASCSSGMCCRYTNASTSQAVFPAPLYGSYKCDTPYFLALAALQSIGALTGTDGNGTEPAFTIYTGDLVSHDTQNQMSRAYVEYTETSIFSMFKSYIKNPIFPVLGNHDSNPENIDGPHSLPGPLEDAEEAAIHYAAYSVKTHLGLRIITLNTDFWYRSNYLNFINTTNPDVSGSFNFMIQELQAAEDAGERVWIIGHVLSGWDGTNPLPNPTNLFYQIVDRYSPHVIANVFFGHTHEDQVILYYSNNGTVQDSSTALTTGWIGPSVTPLTNLNSGYRMYEIDTGTFDIMDAYTFYSDVDTYSSLHDTGPTYQFEYSTRATYGPSISWPDDAPLNATFWHKVTEAMEANRTLVEIFNKYQGKSSIRSPNCTSDACAEAKVCYMRSGSAPIGRACPQGFASVQSPYKGKNF
ncbi:hypothetical protein EYC84_002880 [Monilinia fructicola]|uniref:Calcineurin-like phosphoesterase domain-containing protein n=1 Tax=Monilinia fructicola TaxID=38448 RepID=A0A5M9JRX5_MONFR|nr:hypothetical protein EYC84_002880 [Monilinia fructicola]